MFQSYRVHDPIVTICQDNERRAIEIRELNKQAEETLGYRTSEVTGYPLGEMLPTRIKKLMEEYVEFEEDGNDVGSVLSKVQSFCVVDSHGREVAFRLKVLRSESLDRHSYFRLILQDKSGSPRNEAFRSMLKENFKGHEVLDKNTGLPDRASLTKDTELVSYYVKKEALRACFAVVEMDRHELLRSQWGDDICYAVLKHLAAVARQNLRADDTIGFIGPGRLGIILMDTNMESGRMVLNRLRWLVAASPLSQGGQAMPVTVSITFANLDGEPGEQDIITRVEAQLAKNAGGNGNSLIEVTEEE